MKNGKILVAAALAGLAAGLGGCAGGGGNYYASQPGPNHPFSNAALADDVFVDGTGASSRQAGRTIRYQAEAPVIGAPDRAVARSRPLAIEREARSDAVSGTTGARGGQGQNQGPNQAQKPGQKQGRNQADNDPNKPFSEAWWERERAEDARLKAKMNICRGC